MERALLEERRPVPQRDFLPVFQTAGNIVTAIEGGKADRLFERALELSGCLFGTPTVQTKRILEACKNRDPWGVIAGHK
jgi:hypothetical protein